MNATPAPDLIPPRFETRKAMLLAGSVERHDCQSPVGIPDQWQRFGPYIGIIPRQVGKAAYGACYNSDSDSNFDYLCGVEVSDAADLPKGLTTLHVPEQHYAIFTHQGHVAGIRATFSAIWNKWVPESGRQVAEAPVLERYGPEFNPQTGMGGFEIWLPIEP
jgi:AraC family transcriptional regulator